jgi:hypothetical protein
MHPWKFHQIFLKIKIFFKFWSKNGKSSAYILCLKLSGNIKNPKMPNLKKKILENIYQIFSKNE